MSSISMKSSLTSLLSNSKGFGNKCVIVFICIVLLCCTLYNPENEIYLFVQVLVNVPRYRISVVAKCVYM